LDWYFDWLTKIGGVAFSILSVAVSTVVLGQPNVVIHFIVGIAIAIGLTIAVMLASIPILMMRARRWRRSRRHRFGLR